MPSPPCVPQGMKGPVGNGFNRAVRDKCNISKFVNIHDFIMFQDHLTLISPGREGHNHPPLLKNHNFSAAETLLDLKPVYKFEFERSICLGSIVAVGQSVRTK